MSVHSDIDWDNWDGGGVEGAEEEEEVIDLDAREAAQAADRAFQQSFVSAVPIPSDPEWDAQQPRPKPKGAASKASCKKPTLEPAEIERIEEKIKRKIMKNERVLKQEVKEEEAAGSAAAAAPESSSSAACSAASGSTGPPGPKTAAMANFNAFLRTVEAGAKEAEKLN